MVFLMKQLIVHRIVDGTRNKYVWNDFEEIIDLKDKSIEDVTKYIRKHHKRKFSRWKLRRVVAETQIQCAGITLACKLQ